MVPEDKIVPGFWKGANKVFKPKDWKSIQQNQRDRQTNPENLKKRAKKISANNSKKRKLLKELGIDYDFGEQVIFFFFSPFFIYFDSFSFSFFFFFLSLH